MEKAVKAYGAAQGIPENELAIFQSVVDNVSAEIS